jgi:hypothetical protein
VVTAAEGKYDDAETQFEKSGQIFRRYQVPFEEAEELPLNGAFLTSNLGYPRLMR